MGIQFEKRVFTSEFESPFENFEIVRQSGEIRTCPITGHVSRILPMRLKDFACMDLQPLLDQSPSVGCPFCPENIEKKTPRFSQNFPSPDGRIGRGETTIFPNAFPYDALSAVAVVSRSHFLTPGQFSPSLLLDAFAACLAYLRRAKELFPDSLQPLLNWNYMPLAGAGIIHPHFQVSALKEPTVFLRRVMEKQRGVGNGKDRSLLGDLLTREMKSGERTIRQFGNWHWLTAFAPRGVYEFWGIFDRGTGVLELQEDHLADLARGTHAVLRFLESQGIQALNMGWYSSFDGEPEGIRNWIAIIPRVNFPPLATSDINYFNRLQDESITFVSPEKIASSVKEFLGAASAGG
jgi:UDPglucose--hexose-1-phosphate uridylyltransferase